jgi:hypothetical protein
MRSYLIDTNVLLRIEDKKSDQHTIAELSVKTIFQNGDDVYIAAQNLIEFWAVATRPIEARGLGMDYANARKRLKELQEIYQVIPDPTRF